MRTSALKTFLLLLACAGIIPVSFANGQTVGDSARSSPHPQTPPAALRPALYQAFADDQGSSYNLDESGCAVLSKPLFKACFDRRGAHFVGDANSVSLHLAAFGRGETLAAVKTVKPIISGNRATYVYGALNAWWRVLPMGFEQGFTITKRPAGRGDLTLALTASRQDVGASTTRHSRESGNPVGKSVPTASRATNPDRIPASAGVTENENTETLTWGKLHYGKLVVTDADGRVVPASLTSEGNSVLIAVNDAHAVYPLTVDPLVWLEQKVTASDGAAGDKFGWSVAISGKTAVVGAKEATVNGNIWQGAAYVFTQSNGVWSEAQKLTAEDGVADDEFGSSVAISDSIIVIGAANVTVKGNAFQGAAYVFTRTDGGTWVQSAKLVASDGAAQDLFGVSAAISGTTILVGSERATIKGNENEGAAYVFTGSGDLWTEVQKLTPDDGDSGYFFGASVVISGSTAIVGATQETGAGPGAAYVFSNSDGTWSQTAKLTAGDGANGDIFGLSVAISSSTVVVGAPYAAINDHYGQGAAYVFSNSGGVWTQTQKLFDSDGGQFRIENFGWDVAVSGSTMLIGSFFAQTAFEYTESGGTWALAQKLSPSDATPEEVFGPTVALSGTDALVGAQTDTVNGNERQGSAYFYGKSDLGLAVSAPQTVGQGQQYTSQTIATNNASAASPAVSATIAVPAAASFVSATTSQGACNEDSGVVTCDFGQIEGNAGTATANVTLQATGDAGDTIDNTASVVMAQPGLTASAPTEITSPGSCPAGYTEFSGHLDAGETFTSSPIEVAEAGQKYADLTAPASFAFFTTTNTRYGQHTYVYPHVKHGHRWGAAGSYQVGVQAGPDSGGDYTLCVNLNPTQ